MVPLDFFFPLYVVTLPLSFPKKNPLYPVALNLFFAFGCHGMKFHQRPQIIIIILLLLYILFNLFNYLSI
jgi:hypothetical protein